jgi:hypothetical protein
MIYSESNPSLRSEYMIHNFKGTRILEALFGSPL